MKHFKYIFSLQIPLANALMTLIGIIYMNVFLKVNSVSKILYTQIYINTQKEQVDR